MSNLIIDETIIRNTTNSIIRFVEKQSTFNIDYSFIIISKCNPCLRFHLLDMIPTVLTNIIVEYLHNVHVVDCAVKPDVYRTGIVYRIRLTNVELNMNCTFNIYKERSKYEMGTIYLSKFTFMTGYDMSIILQMNDNIHTMTYEQLKFFCEKHGFPFHVGNLNLIRLSNKYNELHLMKVIYKLIEKN